MVTEIRQRRGTLARWMYRGGHPNLLAAAVNRGWAVAGAHGWWPQRLVTMEVAGRRTGRIISLPLMVTDHSGERYLVSMLGERSSWVANVRAAGGLVVLFRGHRRVVRLREVDTEHRPVILRRFLQVAPGARAHIPVHRLAPLAEFVAIAHLYPVFQIIDHPVHGHPELMETCHGAQET